MPQPAVVVEGLSRFSATLRRAGEGLDDLKDANRRTGDIVATTAMRRAPKRSGNLAASVRSARAANRVTVSAGSASVPYAGPIHWGWPARNITAQPFISDAAVQDQPVYERYYLGEIQKLLDAVKGT